MISAYIIIKKESVRVPNKNFKYLGSRPLYLWCIETLLQVGEIDEVLINTDAKELLDQIPQNSKIRIIERPLYLCGNHFVANDLLRYDLEKFKNQNILMTHVTCPFVSTSSYRKAISSYKQSICDSLMSVNKIQNRFYNLDGRPINHSLDKLVPTQELPPLIMENSCIYIFSKESFKKTGSRIGERPYLFEMPNYETIDIDTFDDWKKAEILAFGLESMEASISVINHA